MLWLENNVGKVLERVDGNDPLVLECTAKYFGITHLFDIRSVNQGVVMEGMRVCMYDCCQWLRMVNLS